MAVRGTSRISMVVLLLVATQFASAQTPAGPPKKPTAPVKTTPPVAVEARKVAPQVVTVVHRLNGLKMFRLLLRSEAQVQAISRIDETFNLLNDVHTNVIAGLAMDDGQTIAAWLPEAELEFGPLAAFPAEPISPATPRALAAGVTAGAQDPLVAAGQFVSPELTVIGSDGKRFKAQYVGLDGVTGLSILRLASKNLDRAKWANDTTVDVGENVRLFGPEPVNGIRDVPAGNLLVRIGETNGTIWKVTRTSDGGVTRFKMRSPHLNSANVGGVALNAAGEAVGIVDGVDGTEANILPSDLIRRAADRVLAQKTSVPKPWLGVKGEPVATLNAGQFENLGWGSTKASNLLSEHRGILLTWIAPGSPAALATLKAGDVILKVNDEDIQNGDDLTWHLNQSDPGKSIQVTIARPDTQNAETVFVKLAGSLSRRLAFPKMGGFHDANKVGLISQGLETIALRPAVARQMGARAGLLVVYVEPATAAFQAGLRPGDVIQSIDGKSVAPLNRTLMLPGTPVQSHVFEIVRNRQKLKVTLLNPEKNQ